MLPTLLLALIFAEPIAASAIIGVMFLCARISRKPITAMRR